MTKHRSVRSFLVACAGLLALGVAGVVPARADTTYHTMEVGSRTRSFYVHVPDSYTGKTPVPLVLMLHGRGGNGLRAERMTGFSTKSDQLGFIVAYPNGWGNPRAWNTGWNGGSGLDPQEDIEFISRLIEALEQRLNIDPARIYAAGHSSGGMMCHLLGSALSHKLAAIGPSAGAVGALNRGDYVETPPPQHPVSVMIVHGLHDQKVPYFGGGQGPYIQFVPVWYSSLFWAAANGCDEEPSYWIDPEERVFIETYANGAAGTEVSVCTLLYGTHAWNSGTTLSVTDLLWDFFMAHPKQ